MAQNTVQGIAAQQLRPIEGAGIGAVVEENLRFWNQVDRQEDAEEKAQEARAAKFAFEQESERNKRLDDYYKNKPEIDSDGYLNYQVSKLKDSYDELYQRNAQVILNGTTEQRNAARIQNEKALNQLRTWSKFNDATQASGERLSEQTYNDAVDYDKKRFIEVIQKGDFIIDPTTAELVTFDDEGNEFRRGVSEVDGFTRGMNYTPEVDFQAKGLDALKTIAQPDINGNIYATDENKKSALARARDWVSDPTQARMLADKLNFGNYQNDRTAFENFTVEDFEDLASQVSDTYIESGFKRVNNSLDNQKDVSTINKNNRSEREATVVQTIVPATENGKQAVLDPKVTIYDRVTLLDADGNDTGNEPKKKADMFIATNKDGSQITLDSKNGVGNAFGVDGYLLEEDTNRIGVYGYREVPIMSSDENGTFDTGKTRQEQVVSYNPRHVNAAASQQTVDEEVNGETVRRPKNESDVRKEIKSFKPVQPKKKFN